MNRIVFSFLYLFFGLFFSGLPSPKSNLITITSPLVKFLNPYILLLLAGPFILVAIAYFRGKKINKSWLMYFPIAAMLFAYLPATFEYIYLSNATAQPSNNLIFISNI
jgi:hypothetical protein